MRPWSTSRSSARPRGWSGRSTPKTPRSPTKKPNIVARIPGQGKKKVLWVGHLDVVPEGKPENWTYGPYSGEIAQGCVWGRGSSDMKGACAAAMVSARILNEAENIPNTAEFWWTCDEEIGGGDGARWLAETGRFKGDVCIIGDGNGGGPQAPSIDLGCKGGARVKLVARGKTAHGSTPFLGVNAISRLIEGVPWVEKIDTYPLDYPEELRPVVEESIEFYRSAMELEPWQVEAMERNFHTPSVTCNIIKGGVKINVESREESRSTSSPTTPRPSSTSASPLAATP